LCRNIVVRKNIKRTLLFILTLCVAGLIFFFSSQPADVSAPLSRQLSIRILKFILSLMGFPEDNLLLYAAKLNVVLRKLAHFTLYGILGILTYLLLETYNLKFKKRILLAHFCCLCYAVSDEIHQLFVPGRAGMVRDVLIDFSGIIAGIAFLLLLKAIKRKLRKV